jgi:hypothetical protein
MNRNGPAGNINLVSPQNPESDQDFRSGEFQKRFEDFRLESDGKGLTEVVVAAKKYGIPFHTYGRGEEGCQCNALHARNFGDVKIETFEKNGV